MTVTAIILYPRPVQLQEALMFAIIHGAKGRRHEVDFEEAPVAVDVAMSDLTVQITMTAPGDLDPSRRRTVTIALPREQLVAAMAEAVSHHIARHGGAGLRVVGDGPEPVTQ